MKIYTRSGDKGMSTIGGKKNQWKSDTIFELVGTIDELNASIGMARSYLQGSTSYQILNTVQEDLFEIGSFLGAKKDNNLAESLKDKIKNMEDTIDGIEELLPELNNFILPSGQRSSAEMHMARCICRRAERMYVSFYSSLVGSSMEKHADSIAYLNRLSDLLFSLARYANHRAGQLDEIWISK